MAYINGKEIDLIQNRDKLVLLNDYGHFYTVGVDALSYFFADDEKFIETFNDFDVVIDFTVCFDYKPSAKYPYSTDDFTDVSLVHQVDTQMYLWVLTDEEKDMIAKMVCEKLNKYRKVYHNV